MTVGNLQASLGDAAKAQVSYRRAVEIGKRLTELAPVLFPLIHRLNADTGSFFPYAFIVSTAPSLRSPFVSADWDSTVSKAGADLLPLTFARYSSLVISPS